MMNDRVYYSREAQDRANQERNSAIVVFMVVGLAIGAVLALMFAPNSGEKTRKELAGSIGDTTSSTVKQLEKEFAELRKKVESIVG
jgi:gas vesicle protein